MTVIIYMNRKPDPELTRRKKEQRSVNIFFKTRDKEVFNFNPDKNENYRIQLTEADFPGLMV